MREDETDGFDGQTWRRLTPSLWVAMGPRGVADCIEIGRRHVLTDGEGRVFGRFRRLEDAQAMLAVLCAHAGGPVRAEERSPLRAG